MYTLFSPVGIAQSAGDYSIMSFIFLLAVLALLAIVLYFWRNTERKVSKDHFNDDQEMMKRSS